MSTRDSALRNTLFSSIGIYTEYFLGMVAAIMVARHLGPTDYGIYGLFIWFASVGVVVTNSGVTNGVIKFVAELRGVGRHDLIVPCLPGCAARNCGIWCWWWWLRRCFSSSPASAWRGIWVRPTFACCCSRLACALHTCSISRSPRVSRLLMRPQKWLWWRRR